MKVSLLLTSSIGKKILMAVSGLFYCFFLVGHLSGNFLLYVSREKFNEYADFLTSSSLIYVAEVVLIMMLLIHIITAVSLTRENRKARGGNYKKLAQKGNTKTNSTYMGISGLLILAFLILHIYTFKFGDWDNTSSNTLYDLVLLKFSDTWYSTIYVICMIILGLHLNHAFKSAFHTLGLIPQTNKKMTRLSTLFAITMTIGFSSFPIYFYFITNFYS